MKMLTGLISLAVLTGVPLLVYFFVTRERPQLVYFLSNVLPADFAPSTNESYIQQLEVANKGSLAAEGILIKLPASVSELRVTRFSESDNVTVTRVPSGHEIRYSLLVPDASFQVLIKSSRSLGLHSNEIGVFDEKGRGEDAIGSSQLSWPYWAAVAIWFVPITLFIAFMIHSLATDDLKRQAEYHPEKILGREKPWYCTSGSWEKCVDESVNNYATGERFVTVRDLSDLRCYRILCGERVDGAAEPVWDRVVNKARELLTRQSKEIIRLEYGLSKLQVWLGIPQPQLASEGQWLELRDEMLRVSEYRLLERAPWTNSPLDGLDNFDMTLFPPDTARRIEDKLYQVQLHSFRIPRSIDEMREFVASSSPSWMRENDFARIKTLCESAIETEEQKMSLSLQKRKLEDDREAILASQRMLSEQTARWDGQLRQLERKLALIDDILRDPSSIDAVERESIPFSPRNWDNLVAVARLMQSMPQTDE